MQIDIKEVIVKEPGKGKRKNPYENNGLVLDNIAKVLFDRDEPMLDCIYINGHDLQPREQPYECKEVWQMRYKDSDTWLSALDSEYRKHRSYLSWSRSFIPEIETRLAYQSIEDAVKGEDHFDKPVFGKMDVMKNVLANKSTPVNEGKEVDELKQENGMLKLHLEHTKRLLSACENALEERDKSLSATHPIEQGKRMVSEKAYFTVEQLIDELQKLSDKKKPVFIAKYIDGINQEIAPLAYVDDLFINGIVNLTFDVTIK